MNRDTAPRQVQRSFSAEIREERKNGKATLVGHAAVFNSLSEDFGGWRERIAPGAFDGVLGDDVYALFNHDPNFIVAATADGTLRLSQDNTGLLAEMEPMDTQLIRDLVVTPIRQGKVRKMSFAFDIPVGGDEWTLEEGTDIRVIKRVGRLYDVSPVTYPAYPGTDISARTLRAILQGQPREKVLDLLRADMTQEMCEEQGGTWDPDTMTCSMPEDMRSSSAAPRLATPKGDGTDTQGVWAEFYRRRLDRHERLCSIHD